jgi:hypothetical protein
MMAAFRVFPDYVWVEMAGRSSATFVDLEFVSFVRPRLAGVRCPLVRDAFAEILLARKRLYY